MALSVSPGLETAVMNLTNNVNMRPEGEFAATVPNNTLTISAKHH